MRGARPSLLTGLVTGVLSSFLGLLVGSAGCTGEVQGQYLCPRMPEQECDKKPSICDPGSAKTGAVVVRWRVADVALGRLLSRGQCCCNPDSPPKEVAAQQCDSVGDSCLASPAWLIRNVQLRITSAADPSQSCTFVTRCTDGELTTPACIVEGQYDLQLVADIEGFKGTDTMEFMCLGKKAVSPASLRRNVRPGQVVNLDGIVLGVNAL